MPVGKTLAVCMLVMVAVGAPARGNGIDGGGGDSALARYWADRNVGGLSNGNRGGGNGGAVTPPPSFTAVTPAPIVPAPVAVASGPRDAAINFDGPAYPNAPELAGHGVAGPWYQSAAYTKFFATADDAARYRPAFTRGVLEDVRRIFANSGLGDDVTLTATPGDAANHTLSVISGASFDGNRDVLGMTYTRGDGFSYLDNFQHDRITDVGALEGALAKNIAHELMHAFGGDHILATGSTVDVAQTSWDHLTSTDEGTWKFSDGAAANLTSLLQADTRYGALGGTVGEQVAHMHAVGRACPQCAQAQQVPEPSTLLIAGLAVVGLAARHRRRARRAA